MSNSSASAQPVAIFPLTVFDRLFERTTFVTGWLVEGMIDGDALGSALRRVTEKWRILAGRLHSFREGEVCIFSISCLSFTKSYLSYWTLVASQGASRRATQGLSHIRIEYLSVQCTSIEASYSSNPIRFDIFTALGIHAIVYTTAICGLGIL